ncbi:DUF6634 family protein [Stagnihabitans tardus]|uniref:Uncharacterized protein n=1 Tax=Stagnihabitans tardus TaxID=2699202 RepID=A0AAE4YGU4_9RHOB|nr:DUF6634 family protein [Stagnihabitans tardus]NBZ89505.1 hypothetical protein [Stagnihabitans tardus]
MEPADPVMPHRPFASLIEKVRAALKTSSLQDVLHDNPMLLDLIVFAEQTVPKNRHLDINDFLSQIEALSKATPAPPALRKAPLLDPWCAVIDQGCPVLIGVVEGHPFLRLAGRMRSSPLFQVSRGQGWARTWSRFYRLSHYDHGLRDKWISRGGIREDAMLIRLED